MHHRQPVHSWQIHVPARKARQRSCLGRKHCCQTPNPQPTPHAPSKPSASRPPPPLGTPGFLSPTASLPLERQSCLSGAVLIAKTVRSFGPATAPLVTQTEVVGQLDLESASRPVRRTPLRPATEHLPKPQSSCFYSSCASSTTKPPL